MNEGEVWTYKPGGHLPGESVSPHIYTVKNRLSPVSHRRNVRQMAALAAFVAPPFDITASPQGDGLASINLKPSKVGVTVLSDAAEA